MAREATLIAHNEAPGVTANQPRWTLRRWHLWLLVLGLLLRVGYSLALDRESSFGGWDGKEYFAYAQSLLSFHGDDYPRYLNFVRPPGYPFFLMPFVAISDSVIWPIQIIQSLMGVSLAIVLGKIAGRWSGQRAGDWAFAGVIAHPFLIYYCAFVLTETLFMILLWSGVGLLQRLQAIDSKRAKRILVCAALTLGFACLVRPALQLFLPVAAIWVGWMALRQDGWPTGLRRTAEFTALVSIVLAPWMIRNFVIHREWTLAPGNAQGVYLFSNSPEYLRLYESRTKDEYYEHQDKLIDQISVKSASTSETWMREARDFRANHASDWWRLQAYKFKQFWTPWLNPLIFSKRDVLLSLVSATPLFLLAAAELIRRRATRDPFLVLLGGLVLVGYVAGGFLFHVQVRYRIPFVDVTFLLLSACFLAHCFQRIPVPD